MFTKRGHKNTTKRDRKQLKRLDKIIDKHESICFEDDLDYLNRMSKEEYMFTAELCNTNSHLICVEQFNSFRCLNKTIKIKPIRFYAFKYNVKDSLIFIKDFKIKLEFFVFDKQEIRDKIQKELEVHYKTNKEEFNYV